jgi:O-antigen ligase
MGFILTILYVFLTIISPDQFGPEWANYHVLTILGGAIAIASIPNVIIYGRLRSSLQTLLLVGFILAIGLSRITNGWYGGAIQSWLVFLPGAAVFFFIVANVTTIRRLEIMTWTVSAACLFVVIEGLCAYYGGFYSNTFVLQRGLFDYDEFVGQFSQLRGAGYLNDPNDFAQMLLITLPLLFFAWRRNDRRFNLKWVILPVALLLWAIYLTHSRGALIGLAAIALIEIRKRVPISVSVALVAFFVAALLALNFSAGRGISIAQGIDRLDLWSEGLQLFKRAPWFGIGFGAFRDFSDITAHNSLVLCLAELGVAGSVLWVALLVTTTMGLNSMLKIKSQDKPAGPIEARSPAARMMLIRQQNRGRNKIKTGSLAARASKAEAISRVPEQWVSAMRLSFISFMTTSWFLSRTYSPTMYLILGLATATLALQKPIVEKLKVRRWVFVTLTTEALAIALIYGIVRLRWAIPI